MSRALVVVVVIVASVSPAVAGRSHFGWLYGTEVNPERNVELETWIEETNKQGAAKANETLIWWGPTVGITPHLELAIPIEMTFANGDQAPATSIDDWGLDARYRFDSPDPIEAGAWTSLVRAGVKRLITDRGGIRGEANLVVGYECGRVLAVADAGAIVERAGDGSTVVVVTPGVGVSVRVAPDLHLGVVEYSELVAKGDKPTWLSVGPSIGLTRGRFWLAGTFGIGVFGMRDAPRMQFGIAF